MGKYYSFKEKTWFIGLATAGVLSLIVVNRYAYNAPYNGSIGHEVSCWARALAQSFTSSLCCIPAMVYTAGIGGLSGLITAETMRESREKQDKLHTSEIDNTVVPPRKKHSKTIESRVIDND
ncbi:hypothetical protein KW805_00670 [Candidatus Pacearchaeota archaeon]|nr:hypothetical protein [Candidatus Pacearchaeota archaeon]